MFEKHLFSMLFVGAAIAVVVKLVRNIYFLLFNGTGVYMPIINHPDL